MKLSLLSLLIAATFTLISEAASAQLTSSNTTDTSTPANAPATFVLAQNYPNPFNPSTTIRYSVPKTSPVVLTIYDILGHEIRTLVNTVKTAGTYSIVWNGDDNRGVPVSSGLYFYRIRAGQYSDMKRMALIK